jgi:translation initiation factor 2 gamma subunit (eIF-2gamma)
MKIAIIGHVDHGKSCLSSAIIEVLKNKSVEVVSVDEKECFDRGVSHPFIFRDEAINITNEMRCNLFTPPMSRAERRKLERKNKKR